MLSKIKKLYNYSEMKKLFIIFFLGLTLAFADETTWSSTRFEYWWNQNFKSMTFRESFSFMPYRIKVGTFQYGGDDYWKQVFSEDSNDLNNSPFITDDNLEFNFVDDIKFRKGLDLEIDFLGYNFFKKIQNSVDIITSLGYKLSKPLNKTLAIGWPNQNNQEAYFYYPVIHNYKINTTFIVQYTENFFNYINYSYGIIDGKLFRDENNDGIINAQGKSESLDFGFNIISNLNNKDYNLAYGFEIGFNKSRISNISIDYTNPISEIKTNDIALRFSVGIIYGGNKTIGDQGFNKLVNSDYVDAINKFNQFKISHLKHPKIKLANKMIDFSYTQIAYDMLYNGIECYRNNKIDSALIWYNQALEKANEATLIYEIESRKYIIADQLYNSLDESYASLSITEKINYLEYIENISDKITSIIEFDKVDLLYQEADMYLSNRDYIKSYNIYQEIYLKYPNYNYIYKGKVNSLISMMIQNINILINNEKYFQAYELTKFLNIVYPDINNYIDDNINLLKMELDFQNIKKRDKLILEIIEQYKNKFKPIDDNSLIRLGDSYAKIIRLLDKPLDLKNREVDGKFYFMAVYNLNNKTYRLFFENEILFDIIED